MSFSTEQARPPRFSIDPLRVRQLFAFPDRMLDSAFLRREIANRMHERLSMIRMAPKRVLDAGCGEGADLALLQAHWPKARIMAVDGALEMLLQAGAADAVCADFARLPFSQGSVDVLWSNLSLHWHPVPFLVFAEWKRVLHQDGMLMFSCFGPETLAPLRDAFLQVDGYAHVLPFAEMHDLGDRLTEAGFSSPVLDREVINVTYESTSRLLSDVRAFGGNPLSARRRGLLGKQSYRCMLDYLESRKDADDRISLPFEIIYGHAFCSHPEREKRAEAPVHFFSRR